MNFSRPCGTHSSDAGDPALKRRAIVGLSRWDEQRRSADIRCRAKKSVLPKSFWDGRPGQMALQRTLNGAISSATLWV